MGFENPNNSVEGEGTGRIIVMMIVFAAALLGGGMFVLGVGNNITDILTGGRRRVEVVADDPNIDPTLNENPIREFEFTDQNGNKVHARDLRGGYWLAGFVFTTCGSTCPQMAASAKVLQDQIVDPGKKFRIVFFSVDPVNDTPEAMKAWMQAHGLKDDKVIMLTGPKDELYKTALDSFQLGVQPGGPDSTEAVIHSRKFALVNPNMRVMAYYDGTNLEELKPLIVRANAAMKPL